MTAVDRGTARRAGEYLRSLLEAGAEPSRALLDVARVFQFDPPMPICPVHRVGGVFCPVYECSRCADEMAARQWWRRGG